MSYRREEPWGRRDKYRGYESGGRDSGSEGRRDRRRDERRDRRYEERRGGSSDDYGRRSYIDGGNTRQVKCYECGEPGHYKSQCPRLHRQGGEIVTMSRELEDSLASVGRMARQLLDQQRETEEARREAEEKKKREEDERIAKEEAVRIEMEKKQAKEEKEQKRQWATKKILAEQREEYEEKLAKIVRSGLKGVTIGGKKKKKEAVQAPSLGSEEDNEGEEEATPLKDKRKRRESTGAAVNSPPVEGTPKQEKLENVGTPGSARAKKGRGRPSRADTQAARMEKGQDPWEGVPMGDKYATEAAFRKAVRKTLGSFYPDTLKIMCMGAGLPFYGVNDAVDVLTELRVTYCYRRKVAGSTSGKGTNDEQMRG
ncbi:hypothetical protein CBR_g63091 [Chara braunii]|uniref:CCHC-type domain-containing protein n=1 Tax=Chara braunii TaxID=69332 RepID=A0A388K8X1_CHABU|nr:hypothetical protein CBR_g63091 [Chara braunii]|eukprot:GBG66508.1 hypothetical protein CBR_g63091 [Chara braunii]